VDGIGADHVIADKGYDSDELIRTIEASGAEAVIPPRSNRKERWEYDQHLYKERNLAERFTNRVKQCRRIATSTTVVTNPAVRPPVFCSGIASRTPDGPAATPTSPRSHRASAGGSTAAAPAGVGSPGPSRRSTPDRPATFFRRTVGQPPHRRQHGLGEQGEGDVPVPTRPAPHLVVGQAGLRGPAASAARPGPGRC
jgi:transposase